MTRALTAEETAFLLDELEAIGRLAESLHRQFGNQASMELVDRMDEIRSRLKMDEAN